MLLMLQFGLHTLMRWAKVTKSSTQKLRSDDLKRIVIPGSSQWIVILTFGWPFLCSTPQGSQGCTADNIQSWQRMPQLAIKWSHQKNNTIYIASKLFSKEKFLCECCKNNFRKISYEGKLQYYSHIMAKIVVGLFQKEI